MSMAFTASNTANCVIAAKRAWKNGFCPAVVVSMIEFHSTTGSWAASATVQRSMPQAAAARRVRIFMIMTPLGRDAREEGRLALRPRLLPVMKLDRRERNFAFFWLMPLYSRLDPVRAVPERLSGR